MSTIGPFPGTFVVIFITIRAPDDPGGICAACVCSGVRELSVTSDIIECGDPGVDPGVGVSGPVDPGGVPDNVNICGPNVPTSVPDAVNTGVPDTVHTCIPDKVHRCVPDNVHIDCSARRGGCSAGHGGAICTASEIVKGPSTPGG